MISFAVLVVFGFALERVLAGRDARWSYRWPLAIVLYVTGVDQSDICKLNSNLSYNEIPQTCDTVHKLRRRVVHEIEFMHGLRHAVSVRFAV